MNIGTVEIKNPLALAPMEDVSDIPFRVICKSLGADLLYTEFTSSEALIRDVKKALAKIEFTKEERPIGIQIFGGKETSMEGAAKVVERFQPDFIDINCGCWVKDVAMRGEGAALLKDLPRFEKIVKSIVQAPPLTVTVKTRLGWDAKSIVILDAAKMVEQAGAKALTIHCRTRDQGHSGNADWTWLEKIKRAVSIPIIGNGDITIPQDAKRMFETGCDGVMIGRGAIANPWIFGDIKHFLKTDEILPPAPLPEKILKCIEHLRLSVKYNGPWHGVITFRKYYAGYLRGIPHAAKLRGELMGFTNMDDVIAHLEQFLSVSLREATESLPAGKAGSDEAIFFSENKIASLPTVARNDTNFS